MEIGRQLVGFGTEVRADEYLRGLFEQKVLNGRVEPKVPCRGPIAKRAIDTGPHQFEVSVERAAGEGLLHDAAVVAVLVEVEQHDSAVEERSDDRCPAAGAGEHLVPVDPCGFQGVRAHEADDAKADAAAHDSGP